MLRLHFTTTDLLRTRFASAPAPLLELSLALATAQRRDPLFDGWRQRVARQLPPRARPLLDLVPASGTGPTFLDPISTDFDGGLDTVLSTPARVVAQELRRTQPSGRPATAWIRALDNRDRAAWRDLGYAVRAAYQTLIVPSWSRIRASFHADITLRSRLITESGLHAALRGLHPGSTWHGATLHVPAETELDAHLAGRGVTLMPSGLWTGRPLLTRHPDGSTLIVYAASTPLPVVVDGAGASPLDRVLGTTRAAILRLTTAPHTTSELARELGISAASASEHAKTLRGAGLIATVRDGKAVQHRNTPLGARMLAG